MSFTGLLDNLLSFMIMIMIMVVIVVVRSMFGSFFRLAVMVMVVMSQFVLFVAAGTGPYQKQSRDKRQYTLQSVCIHQLIVI